MTLVLLVGKKVCLRVSLRLVVPCFFIPQAACCRHLKLEQLRFVSEQYKSEDAIADYGITCTHAQTTSDEKEGVCMNPSLRV